MLSQQKCIETEWRNLSHLLKRWENEESFVFFSLISVQNIQSLQSIGCVKYCSIIIYREIYN